MKTENDFLELAIEANNNSLRGVSVEALAELLQTVYEAGAGDERNATIGWLEEEIAKCPGNNPLEKFINSEKVLETLRSFNGWRVRQ